MEPRKPYPAALFGGGCPCKACVPPDADPFSFIAQVHLCPHCGNKRCPGAADHTRACSGSNDLGQPGSLYPSYLATTTQNRVPSRELFPLVDDEDAVLFAVALDRARRDKGARHSLEDVAREMALLDGEEDE